MSGRFSPLHAPFPLRGLPLRAPLRSIVFPQHPLIAPLRSTRFLARSAPFSAPLTCSAFHRKLHTWAAAWAGLCSSLYVFSTSMHIRSDGYFHHHQIHKNCYPNSITSNPLPQYCYYLMCLSLFIIDTFILFIHYNQFIYYLVQRLFLVFCFNL